MQKKDHYRPVHAVRVVTAASLFDGHDAAIHIMRRILQQSGAEVIHLGHNRSVRDVVAAAIHEDAQAVAISSYQGGHMEYFRYLRRLLDEQGGAAVRIFGGGGGVIVPEEIAALEAEGSVDRIYSPEDGRRMGLQGLIDDLLQRADFDPISRGVPAPDELRRGSVPAVARFITLAEADVDQPGRMPPDLRQAVVTAAEGNEAAVVGLTGTGGAGKSSLTDELIRRWLYDHATGRVAVLSVDPTRKRSGGALLGDRIRMNAIDPDRVYMRSLATRGRKGELSGAITDAITACKAAGMSLVLVETSGIGQGDADITEIADVSIYVMTPEYGAPSQLEKIDMLDYGDLVVINKFSRRGGMDALRDVRKQVRRNRQLWDVADEALPVFGTEAARFNDEGVTALYHALLARIDTTTGGTSVSRLPRPTRRHTSPDQALIAPERERYLASIAAAVREYHQNGAQQIGVARQRQRLLETLDQVRGTAAEPVLAPLLAAAEQALEPEHARYLEGWPQRLAGWQGPTVGYVVRGQRVEQPAFRTSLAGQRIPRVVLPEHTTDHGEILRFALKEGVPGEFPYTGGVFPLRREGEDPKRMFAGEGGPDRTNHRFHLLCAGEKAHRLSTAFDSVTLYGEDPAERPDIWGKIGESGVSVPHLDDMKRLYAGFDLCAPATSVSMTINGPAPILLAMFFNTAIDDLSARWSAAHGREPTAEERQTLATEAVRRVRGTVQADILKEDQAQNTCIFSTPFALRMMGDIQRWFIDHEVRNFYSVSISGYHIAEAGANPITQLAFTLANGLTFLEYYLNRGMKIDDFAPNLSFFFSNGLDPEYAVIGRVARRIWAITLRERYGASARSQMLKYHIQTSGRSLHAREVQFNDIRTTLQALLALSDACNSLHTNAYDEAITTPTEESVRRAMAIQLIIQRELGTQYNENNLQGSWFIEHLTDLVEEAVLQEFEQLDRRGGVLGAMELQYQRSKIQEESMLYEHRKHDGSLPIIGINTFLDPAKSGEDWQPETPELRRASQAEKDAQIHSVSTFQATHAAEAPEALARLQAVAVEGGNLFGELMNTVRVATLGQITRALYAVGGEYRRNL